jgi:hypothetical protein
MLYGIEKLVSMNKRPDGDKLRRPTPKKMLEGIKKSLDTLWPSIENSFSGPGSHWSSDVTTRYVARPCLIGQLSGT